MKRPRWHRNGEEGSALVIALFFAIVFSLFVASVISFAEVGLRASKSFEGQGQSAYATDGAVNAAINRFRDGGSCDDYTAPVGPDDQPLYGRGVIVRCVDDDRPASGRATKPVNALLSLGSEGISTSGEQRVLGNIFSNSTVAAGATLIVQGQVSATSDCNGPIQITPQPPPPDPQVVPKCANTGGGADESQGRDRDYTKARSTVPVRQKVPACPVAPAERWLVELKPGYYDDDAALSALTNGGCPGRVVWLQPGDYYLDFTFRDVAGTWTINDPSVVVVAGTPKGWIPSPQAPLPAPPISVPGSCKTAADPAPFAGVQLVAGGGTHLQITKGQVELCAEPSTTDQSIALYGIPARSSNTRTLEPTDWAGVSGFTNPDGATTIGETPAAAAATAELRTGPSSSASLILNAFRPPVPDGSLIDSATLRVVHREDGDMDDAIPSVKVAAAFPGSTCTGLTAAPVPVSLGALVEHRVDLKAVCGIKGPAAFADLAVTYSAALKAGGATATATLDGIAVEVAYRSPRTGKPTVVKAFSSPGFVNPNVPPTDPPTGTTPPTNALEIGEQPTPLTADAVLSDAGPTTASITVAGLGDPPIPPGSTIDSAVLRVAHRDQGEIAPPTVTVPFPGGSCNGLELTVRPAGIVDDRVDLKNCGLVTAADLVGLTATYAVALATGGVNATANLDGMWLELVYSPPPLTRPPATVTPAPLATSFANPGNAKVIGESPAPLTADATLTSTATTASLAFAGYDQQPPAVPAGSFIDSAVLRVAHQDLGPMGTPALAVAFPGMGTCSPALTKRPATIGEDSVDLKACGLTDPAMLAGLSVTYTANLTTGTVTPPDATARVDGVVLDLAYRPPATRRPATATTTTPGFSNPDNAKIVGESPTPLTADVTLANGAAPASVTVNGYDSAVPLPAGSVIDSAVLRVAHRDDAWMGPPTLAATFTGSTTGCPGLATTLPRYPAAIGVDRIDLRACGLTRAEQLADLAAAYTANPPTTTGSTQVPATATSTAFANPGNARAIGESPTPLTADAALDSATTPSASITLSTYDQPVVPAGSTISSAVLRLAHQDAGVGQVTASIAFTGSTCAPQTFAARATLGEDTIDLAACGLTNPSQLTGLAVVYGADHDGVSAPATARLDGVVLNLSYQAPSGTDRLDGIELDIVFRTPAFRPLDGCLTGTYPAYPAVLPNPALACALVKVTPATPVAGEPPTRFAAQGTIYAPSAALDISMNGLTGQVLTRGLVARTIRLGLRAAPGYNRPLMGVPPEPVRFTAYPDVTARATRIVTSGFVDPNNAKAIGESPAPLTANAALSSTGTTSASITLDRYTQDLLSGGAPIDVAVLRVAHREDVGANAPSVKLEGFLVGPCAPEKVFSLPPNASGLLREDQIDLTAECGLTTADLAGLIVTYTATVPVPPATTSSTAYLDGITIDLLSGPLLRARVAFDTTNDKPEVQGWSVLR